MKASDAVFGSCFESVCNFSGKTESPSKEMWRNEGHGSKITRNAAFRISRLLSPKSGGFAGTAGKEFISLGALRANRGLQETDELLFRWALKRRARRPASGCRCW